MKIERSKSEARFRDVLIKVGFDPTIIKEPDSDTSIIGTADFLVGDVVFEVKEIVPNKSEQLQINRLKDNVQMGKVEALKVADKTKQFKNDISDARKKFRSYTNCATVLVEDLTEWWWDTPDIERMMFGTQTINIDRETGSSLGVSWTDREIRLDQNRSIGTYVFMTSSQTLIYHNLMAHEYKIMPVDYIKKFMKITAHQYMFVNIPNTQPLIRTLM